MNMNFKRKLPTPKEIKEMYPLDSSLEKIKNSMAIIQNKFPSIKVFFSPSFSVI